MLKNFASGVLASFRPSTYPREYASEPLLAAALPDSLFEHPAWLYSVAPEIETITMPQQFFRRLQVLQLRQLDFGEALPSPLWYQFLPCCLPFLSVGDPCSKMRRVSP